MNNHNLSLSSSQKQLQQGFCEKFPCRYYYEINHEVDCDVKLSTDDGTIIYARKIDLENASTYFYIMFNRFDEKDKDHVVLKKLDSMALTLLIDYVYTNRIVITEENVKVLLFTANYLMFMTILKKCCVFLQNHLRPSNCLSTKEFADFHSCSTLVSSSKLFIEQKILKVIECDEFLSIPSERLEEVIELMSYVERTISNEKQVIAKCVMNWVNHQWYFRKGVLAELLEHIHLPLATKQCIINGVDERSSTDNVIENIEAEQLAIANLKKKILVFGWSFAESEYFTEWYDPETKEWNLGSEFNEFDHNSSLVVRNGLFVYAFGSFFTSDSVYMLDLSSHSPTWVPKESMFIQRSQLGVGLLNDWIYAVGGFDGNHELDKVEAFNVNTEKWKMISSMSTTRGNVGVGVLNNHIYAIGGYDGLSKKSLNSVEFYDPSVDRWIPINSMRVCRSGPGVGVLNGLMYVIGGHDGIYYHKSVEVYDPNTGLWTFVADMHNCRTNPGMGVIVLHGLLYVLGGRNAFNDNGNSVEIYNPNTDTWEHMVTASRNVGKIYGGVAVNELPYFVKN